MASVTQFLFGWARQPIHAWLAYAYLAVWLWAAWKPVSFPTWALENVLLFVGIWLMFRLYKRFPMSNTSYVMITLFMVLHTLGSHYTYSNTPWGNLMGEWVGWERNHYDRVVHFLSGLMGYWPFREVITRHFKIAGQGAEWLTFCIMATLANVYEVIEFVAAMIAAPDEGMAFLGTQGDVFDAQKDTGLALIGTLVAMNIAKRIYRKGAPGPNP
ncbi:MAG: DUF2238 domain-containing protein [Sphingomonadales bacterium]|nr:DUF2238 domain-containing protein [Sphingomonadales bacterium]